MRHLQTFVIVLTMAGAAGAAAQCPGAPPLAGPGTLVGTVRDTARSDLDSVEVLILSARRTATSKNGGFRFDKLEAQRYQVSVRRFGYQPQTRVVTVGDSGGAVSFCLTPLASTLAPVISSAPRGGLSGVIADTAFGIIPGAEVKVLGGGESAISDSIGKFYVGLKPGRYMVRVSRAGFASKMASVTIPNDSGRTMLIWLLPSDRGTAVREEIAAQELAMRIDTASPSHSRIFTREDISHSPMVDLQQIATVGAVSPVGDNCIASIDGGMYSLPVWALKSADLEMVEVYTDRGPIAGSRSRPGVPAKCPKIFAWLRKP